MKIILITNEFPFGYRETFLESEIKILADRFEKIVIIPTKDCDSIRSVPANIVVDYTLIYKSRKKLYWILRSFFSGHSYKTFFKYSKYCLNIEKMLTLFKYMVVYNVYKKNLIKTIEKHYPTLVYSYWFSPIVDVLAEETKKFKLITRVHRGDLYEEISTLGFFPFRENTINKIDRIISISLDGKLYLERKYGIKNILLSRLGVINLNEAIVSYSRDNISIVSVSNIIDVKRVCLIAKSLLQFARQNPKYNVIWNHFGDGEQRPFVENILVNMIEENLEYKLHGIVANKDIFDFYRQGNIDLFINLSKSEGIPVSIMEAISFGIPILATNVGGVSEIVNEITGILLEENPTIDEVVASILDIKRTGYDKSSIIKFWDQNYNADKNYNSFVDIIKSM